VQQYIANCHAQNDRKLLIKHTKLTTITVYKVERKPNTRPITVGLSAIALLILKCDYV